MIIDCHGHYTTAPKALEAWRRMMHVVAGEIEPGDIVVAAITAECTDGYFGDLRATSFMARGAKGLVIDAGVRDVKALRAPSFLTRPSANTRPATAAGRNCSRFAITSASIAT